MVERSREKPKRHLVAAVGDVELYRIEDAFGCQWIRTHAGIETCMSEKCARLFFLDAKRSGEIFDLEQAIEVSEGPSEDPLEEPLEDPQEE
jgi:hypothetical protein